MKQKISLARALKEHKRLVGDYNKAKSILARENVRRSDSVSKVDRKEISEKVRSLLLRIVEIKALIAKANVDIVQSILLMGELKGYVTFINSLDKKEGESLESHGYGQNQVVKSIQSESFINQEKADAMVASTEKEIATLQDEIDAYNATHYIEWDLG